MSLKDLIISGTEAKKLASDYAESMNKKQDRTVLKSLCEHDYEPDTFMTGMYCSKCGKETHKTPSTQGRSEW